MILGIEASNIKAGGGLTHLRELILAYQPEDGETLVLFAGKKVLESLPNRDFVLKSGHSWLEKGALFNMLWRIFILPIEARKQGISLLFSPGGNWLFGLPFVSMSQNMLVFESIERNRFPSFKDRSRYQILEIKQFLSFYFSSGILFISEYARKFILNKYPSLNRKSNSVVYHGVSDRFSKTLEASAETGKTHFLYVSILNYYKHQDILIEAFRELQKTHPEAELDLVGPAHPAYLKDLQATLDAAQEFVHYHGMIPHSEIHEFYKQADAFIFASTCENMPNILVEAMRSGLPVICSNFGPMPEILGETGLYFDPTSVSDCHSALLQYINNKEEFRKKAEASSTMAAKFTWGRCAKETFDFLRLVAKQ